MMKKSLLRTLLFSFFINFLVINISGQKNFLPGYVIDTDRDTIHGLIDYQNWERNPRVIDFKAGPDQRARSYSVRDIRRFAVKDEIYISAGVEVETSARSSGNLDYDPAFRPVFGRIRQIRYTPLLFGVCVSDGIQLS